MTFVFGKETFRPAFGVEAVAKISYGLPFSEACEKHIRETFQRSRVFIIASAGLSASSDALQRLQQVLGERAVGVHIGMGQHTPLDDCLKIITAARDLKADALITLGAGSITDAAKVVRFALANDVMTLGDFDTLWGGQRTHNPDQRSNIHQPNIPLICVPTSLSGGEYQAIAGATHPTTRRKQGYEPQSMPDLVVLDPELCTTTPAHVWLSTGVRSIDHCVETACALKCDTYAKAAAIAGLRRLTSGLLETHSNPGSLNARFECQLGVIDAMQARTTGVPLGASHGIGHHLGPFGVGHGETSCIMSPVVCKYNLEKGANVEQQHDLAAVIRKEPNVASLLQRKGLRSDEADLGDILGLVIDALGLPRSLKEVGIGETESELLAHHSLDDPWLKTNPVPLTSAAQVMEIVQRVMD